MVKRILSSLATLTLVAGSVTTTTAWTEHKTSNKEDSQNLNSKSSEDYNVQNDDYKNLLKNSFLGSKKLDDVYVYNNVIYVATDLDKVYESRDGGKTFVQNTSFTPFGPDSEFKFYAYNNVIYVYDKLGSDFLLESTDGGKTFVNEEPIAFTLNPKIDTIYGYNKVIYLGTKRAGLWESIDNGSTFHQTTFRQAFINHIINDGVGIYLTCVYAGVFESYDNGKSFTRNTSVPIEGNTISLLYYYNNVLYVDTDNGLYEASDGYDTFVKNTYMPPQNDSLQSIYAYNNVVYVGTYFQGLWESFDNGKTFTQNTSLPIQTEITPKVYAHNGFVYVYYSDGNIGQKPGMTLYNSYDNGKTFSSNKSIPSGDAVSSINLYSAFNNIAFIATSQGLFESGQETIANVDKPNETLGQGDDLFYNHPINFSFDWTLLSSVTIKHNTSFVPVTDVITSGNYQIKNNGNYTVKFIGQGGQIMTKTFYLDTKYDFSTGFNTTTFNKTNQLDSNGNLIYDLDIAIDGETAYELYNYIQPGKEGDTDSVLDDLVSKDILDNPWKDSLSQNSLEKSINKDGSLISPYQKTISLYNQITESSRKLESWLNYSGHQYADFHGNLYENLKNKNQSKDLSPNHGVILRFLISCPKNGSWSCQNFNSADSGHAYDNIVLPQKGIKDTEYAEYIADKLQGKTIVLDPKFWVGKDIKNYKEKLDDAIVAQGILTQQEVQYVSWGDLTLNQARSYPNCDFTVSKDGETVMAHNVILNVENKQDKETFNQINNLIEKDIIKEGSDYLQYWGQVQNPYQEDHQYIDTSIPEEMQDLINSIGLNWNIVADDPNFNKEYGKYISFDKIKIYQNQTVTMHLKVGNYTKDYQIQVNWRVESIPL